MDFSTDSIPFAIALLILGTVMLYYGAEGLVKGSVKLAFRIGITPLIIGLTVVAFGTSSPELVVSLSAGYQGSSEIAIGNVIGSNICNIALILGLAALIRPIQVKMQLIKADITIMIAFSILVFFFIIDGEISQFEGVILVISLFAYIYYNVWLSKKNNQKIELEDLDIPKSKTDKPILDILLIVAGLVILMLGAHTFLEGAIRIAKYIGASNAIIGLTVVAFGTSLPELATSVVASIKNEGDISIGNAVGSNIFNLLMILGATGLFYSINTGGISYLDYGVMIGTSAIIIPMALFGMKIGRINGAILILIYIAYMSYLFSSLQTYD
ncbi:MAG: calcium/sodium antiporter [Desulfobulbaceae bacterium]|nr:calcium/sodium antiporter [Desulfobulbaceae bacterium]